MGLGIRNERNQHESRTASIPQPQTLAARLNAEETGWYLGFTTREIPHLTRARLLKPLGSPKRFAHKFYATVRLRRLREDERWLNKASETIFKFWQDANDEKDKKPNRSKPPE